MVLSFVPHTVLCPDQPQRKHQSVLDIHSDLLPRLLLLPASIVDSQSVLGQAHLDQFIFVISVIARGPTRS